MSIFDPNAMQSMDANSNAYDYTQQQFEQQYGSGFVDNTFSSAGFTGNYTEGYSESFFGNDPLSKAQHYQCPKFNQVIWVDAYIREDGTLVDGHLRTKPDDTTWNNLKP